jgi:GT2 family glycosyltransferase
MSEIIAEITHAAGATVHGRLVHASGKASTKGIAVLLDGAHAGMLGLEANDGGAFSFTVPRHLVCARVELADAQSGISLLPAPFDMSSQFRLRVTRFSLDNLRVSGSFTLALERDPVLFVQLVANGVVIGRCFATIEARSNGAAKPMSWTYKFAWPLASLCPLDQSYDLRLRIGGQDVADGPSVRIDAQAIGLVGYVDKAEADVISGWAVDLAKPKRRLSIDLLQADTVLSTCRADLARHDLTAFGLGDGHSAFRFKVAEVPLGAAPKTYTLRLSGTETQLINSPVTLDPAVRLIGYFDDVSSGLINGWIVNLDEPDRHVEVDVVCDGKVIAGGTANVMRLDVERAGISTPQCGFRINLGAALLRAHLGRPIEVRVRGTTRVVDGSPKVLAENPNIARFLTRGRRLNEQASARLHRRLNHRAAGQHISVIMPVYNTKKEWLIEALESVRTQWCDNWEIICVNDCSTEPHVAPILEAYARHDARFRVMTTVENVGIARATNFGLRAARYDHVTFMDHDDFLEPDAIYCLIRAIIETGADLIYSDEVLTYEDISSIMEVRARPAFSHDYYLSHPYFVHMLCVRSDLVRQLAGWDECLTISADVDFVLRVLEVAKSVAHVPTVLYRWRTHSASAGHFRQNEVMAATRSAIARHLRRRGVRAEVSDGVFFNQFRVDYPDDDGEILIVIPTKNKTRLLKTCIDSIERTSRDISYRIVVIDHESNEPAAKRYLQNIAARHTVMPYKGEFNYARMNNLAVRKYGNGAKYILFCNNDIEATEPGWLSRLRSLANRKDVGAVGPLLLYGDKRVQHAGVIIGFNNAAEHVAKFVDAFIEGSDRRNLGYNCTLSSLRDFSAVTAACLLLQRHVFEQVGGFDEAFAIGFNDTDLCLRIGALGYKVLYDGHTWLYHHESATRSVTKQVSHPVDDGLLRRRWAGHFSRDGDPFYNPNLDRNSHDHTLRADAACRHLAAIRVTRLGNPPQPGGLDGVLSPVDGEENSHGNSKRGNRNSRSSAHRGGQGIRHPGL